MAILSNGDGPDLPGDLIGLAEACRLIPSSRPGKRLNVCTLWRWVSAGKLRGWRIGGRTCVSRAEVLALFQPIARREAPRLLPTRREEAATARWVDATLKRHGLG